MDAFCSHFNYEILILDLIVQYSDVSLYATNGSLYFILAVLVLLQRRSSAGLFLVGPMNDLNLQGLVKAVTKMVTGCLRMIKVAIFAVRL